MTSGLARLTVDTDDAHVFDFVFSSLSDWLLDIPNGCDIFPSDVVKTDGGMTSQLEFYGYRDNEFGPTAMNFGELMKEDQLCWKAVRGYGFRIKFDFTEKGVHHTEEFVNTPVNEKKEIIH